MSQASGDAIIIGCGYVGGALAQLLLNQGYTVTGLRESNSAMPYGVNPVFGDVTTPGVLDCLPLTVTHLVYMLGARDSTEAAYEKAYLVALCEVLNWVSLKVRPAPKFYFVSSTSVYGQDDGEWVDEDSETTPRDFRGRVLLEAEHLVKTAGLPSITVRFGGIYGPGRIQLLRSLNNHSVTRRVGASSFTNRIHQTDCARMLSYLMRLETPASLYLGVDCEPVEQGVLMQWLAQVKGETLDKEESLSSNGRDQQAFSHGKRCSNKRIRKEGFTFQYPTYREGYGELIKANL